MSKRKERRNMKVYGSSGYNFQCIPLIMLKGKWLKELGFDSNTPIKIKCENGKLTITPREPEKQIIRTIISDVVIDQELPVSDRVASYIRQIGNPYCYKSHGVVVKINFAGERHLEDCIQNCMNV